MFRVTHGKVKFDGTIYGKNVKAGDIISGLSDEQEKSLADKNYGEIIDATEEKKKKEVEIIPDKLNIEGVEELISKTDDLDTLYTMLEYEESTKNRKGVKEPLEEKIIEIEKEEEEEGEPANINLDINPDDLVQD